MIENKQFNRIESENENYYINEFGYNVDQDYTYTGYIKCKLAHITNLSIIIPDQIYIELEKLWIQPLSFFPNILFKEDKLIVASIYIDISCGNTIKIEFTNKDFIRNYEDGANLFKCKIYGPKDLNTFATGTYYLTEENIPFLQLYHHTTEEKKLNIINSGCFWLSPWNIQGNKTLINIGYVYLTCLEKIKTENDLRKIAMASNEKIHLITDNIDIPPVITRGWRKLHHNEILELKVYRQNTNERQSTLTLKIDATILSPQHILKHSFKNNPVFYEIVSPFIYRIGAIPKSEVYFYNFIIRRKENDIKQLDYIICGDATTKEGLAAPFDEENTNSIFKIKKVSKESNILEFWYNSCNMDHFTNNVVETQIFNKNKSHT